ncbi:Catechol-2,3-dioxygenase [Defluviimonas aquaemixtae]|uniref:Catechol-2,3-dioxygenase n=1 Tax=Albidovulum aquaemixtae TaxID=1542388 RepID=A0A2R8B2U8_9RHOB|nr:VOC family protein [Defluviimonas aquaemixtae]SPH16954.1 Catechol-2,3-dioxygenase [Defluviimonas aquaemixtae]
MHTSTAPVEIGRVALTVNDIATVAAFYETLLGLDALSSDGELRTLGAGGRTLLELRSDPAARRASPREAGLFHTAFLLPARSDLAAWLHHASAEGLPVTGASDHGVSEAIYLTDPEGNGIEIYRDRPRDEWPRKGREIAMVTEPLDVQSLAAAATASWHGAPEGTVVGHVHLQVGSLPEAEAFYTGTLGLNLTQHYAGAAFYGSGGYHHHLATNIWNSRGAGPRSDPATGLAEVELLAAPEAHDSIVNRNAGRLQVADPWGIQFALTRKDG